MRSLAVFPMLVLCLNAQSSRPYFTEPHAAPDRTEIAFVSGSDIWRVDAKGGEASLLVSHPAEESRPLYSPDGKRLAFVSTRTGGGDLYVLTFASGELRRITFEDGREDLDAWSRDGQWLYFHSAAGDIEGMVDVYRVPAAGGTPTPVAADRYATEYFAAPSPDGKQIALNYRGIAVRQWWRKGHSHIDMSRIVLLTPGAVPAYEAVTDGGAKEIWPMWAADGKSFFFVSDRTGVENLWRQPLGGTSRQVTQFKDGRVLWPSIAYDGKTVLFERDFGIWRLETGSGKVAPVAIHLRGAAAGGGRARQEVSEFQEISLSPDGKKLVVAARGELFAVPARDSMEAQPVARTPGQETQVAWAPDSRRIVYVSDRDGPCHLFLYDFGTRAETRLTTASESDAIPRFSPDGKQIAFTRGGRGLWIYDVEQKVERQLAGIDTGRQPLVRAKTIAWSPDGKHLAFISRGVKGFSNVSVVPAQGGAPQAVSYLANSFTQTVAWHPDGTALYFDTAQRTEPARIARVDLVPRTPRFREDKLRDLFERGKAREQPASFAYDDIRQRLLLLDAGLDVRDFEISPNGKQLMITAEAAGQENLYAYSIEEPVAEPPVARQVTSTRGAKEGAQFAPDGREVFYLERGRVHSVALDVRVPRPWTVRAESIVDFEEDKRAVFQQAWTWTRDHFFDEKYNGADWEGLRKVYAPLVDGARTRPELYRLLNLLHGELNASHLGVNAAAAADSSLRNGRLGVLFDAAAYEARGEMRISEVIPLSPAAVAGVQPGELLLDVDGVATGRGVAVAELLEGKAGRRVELMLRGAGGQQRSVTLQPVRHPEERLLAYRAWVEANRDYVRKASGGRLGYVHMADMGETSLARLYLDLDVDNQAKEGVVVDVRNNRGGFVNAYALDVLARRPYLTFAERGRPAVPARAQLGQRALELPTILITNQHSLSDAEDFSEGYRRLKLGKVVGEPTAGWIIYTRNQRMIDGSTLRMPRIKVFDNDGVLMEMHPRPVDVPVERPAGESYSGKDSQLDTAVRELLQQIESGGKPKEAPSAGAH